MAQDYFAILGLSPGRHDTERIARHFVARRDQLLRELPEPAKHSAARKDLEELYLAYETLRSREGQAEYLRATQDDGDATAALRGLIAASLEDGLLRHSRRQMIIDRAAELGFSEFQAQLLIAQVQFGEHHVTAAPRSAARRAKRSHPRTWARFAAAGVLALAFFLYMVRWVEG